MSKNILFCVFLLLAHTNIAQPKTDYTLYHQYINKAESYFFLENNVDSCLYYYNLAFDNFDYNFVKDLYNATQIAYFSKKAYKPYLIKGFLYGLKIQHFKNNVLTKPIYESWLCDDSLKEAYRARRAIYLKNIQFDLLLKMYDLGINDQINKNLSRSKYAETKQRDFQILRLYTQQYGFPNATIIGIDDDNIFDEIQKPQYNLQERKKRFNKKLEYYKLHNNNLESSPIIVLLYHNQCSYLEWFSQLRLLIAKGDLHPRNVGILYDAMYRDFDSGDCIGKNKPNAIDGLFYLDPFCNYKLFNCSKEKTNTIRKQWHIVPLEVDEQKRFYEKRYGFILFHGEFGML